MRRRFALLLFAALALLAIDPVVVRVALANRAAMHRFFTIFPDRLWYPDYPAFLAEVRAHTQPGDTIAILVPSMRWEAGYSYAYYRASYVLAGREVLPLVQPDDSAVPENLARAKFVAAWHRNLQDPLRRVIWAGRGGALAER
jgi:hypothetical protein